MPEDINTNEVIQFVGVSDLNEEEQEVVNKITTDAYEKIKRDLSNIVSLLVHVKTYKKEGDRKKYSVHLKVDAPGKNSMASASADDWELASAMHQTYDKVLTQIKHELHNDVSRPRG